MFDDGGAGSAGWRRAVAPAREGGHRLGHTDEAYLRFAVDALEYDEIWEAVQAGEYEYDVVEETFDVEGYLKNAHRASSGGGPSSSSGPEGG